MPNFAQITVVGHLGRDPEVRATKAGKSVCSCSLAYTPGFGDNRKDTIWFELSIWDKSGGRFAEWFKKGDAVMVVGNLDQDTYTAKDGTPKSKLVVTVREFVGMTPKEGGSKREAPIRAEPINDPKGSEDIPF